MFWRHVHGVRVLVRIAPSAIGLKLTQQIVRLPRGVLVAGGGPAAQLVGVALFTQQPGQLPRVGAGRRRCPWPAAGCSRWSWSACRSTGAGGPRQGPFLSNGLLEGGLTLSSKPPACLGYRNKPI